MIHNTKGIVLRTTKYGETSVIVNIFTELFGIQSYLANGIRNTGKTSPKAGLFQPTSILEMEVYHNELKNLQRIKEFKWSYLYKTVLSDVTKNSVAVYMMELLQKCLKQPENNPALFRYCENSLVQLDIAPEVVTANFPIYFSLQLAHFLGFGIRDNYSQERSVMDLQEGIFTLVPPSHSYFIDGDYGFYISQLLKVRHPDELTGIKLHRASRKEILLGLQTFYSLHIQEFGTMKTLPVLHEVLG